MVSDLILLTSVNHFIGMKTKKDWVDPQCKEKYKKFVELKERSSQSNAPFMSQEEMSIEVFGKRSSHIIGWRVGSKSFKASSTIGQLKARDEEVRQLREQLVAIEE